MELSGSIAKNLTKLRKREGLSIGSLAEKTGISKAAISQIEQGKGNPTISTISKLASALHVGYQEILAPAEPAEAKMLFADEVPIDVGADGSWRRYLYYKTSPDRDFEISTVELEPGCKSSFSAEDGVVAYVIVNKGSVVVEIGEFSYFLMEGDAISFGAGEGCVLKNETQTTSNAVCVSHYL